MPFLILSSSIDTNPFKFNEKPLNNNHVLLHIKWNSRQQSQSSFPMEQMAMSYFFHFINVQRKYIYVWIALSKPFTKSVQLMISHYIAYPHKVRPLESHLRLYSNEQTSQNTKQTKITRNVKFSIRMRILSMSFHFITTSCLIWQLEPQIL